MGKLTKESEKWEAKQVAIVPGIRGPSPQDARTKGLRKDKVTKYLTLAPYVNQCFSFSALYNTWATCKPQVWILFTLSS